MFEIFPFRAQSQAYSFGVRYLPSLVPYYIASKRFRSDVQPDTSSYLLSVSWKDSQLIEPSHFKWSVVYF